MESIPPPTQRKPLLILFDVYETLLDMELFEKKVNDLLNNKRGYTYWFELFMQYCFVENSMGTYHSFTSIAEVTLQMAGKKLGITINADQAEEVIVLLNHLPLKDGVTEVLSALNDKGFRIAALTNAPRDVIANRMERTGLISYFEVVLSSEQIKKYKPDREVYLWAIDQLDLSPKEILFVSSHSWDIAGASNVGMQSAFLNRTREHFYSLAPEPTYHVQKLEDLAQVL